MQVDGDLNKEAAGEYILTYRLKEKDVEVKKTRKITILPDETEQTEQAVQAEPAEPEETVTEAAPAPQPNASLSFLGTTIPFIASNGAAEAPASGAGTWTGTGAVNDGAPTHFIGHNPGDFSPVMNLTVGSPITVVDAAGNTKTYTVYEVLDVRDDGFNANNPADDTWFRVIDAGGERISLQTCITDTVNRVVLAQ
ncbi:sortase [Enterococcus sp. 669A]|uniref:Sortase n=1 Tax=Candidatus Enterococcus moelleringii TaxID=2815325 RepID=A0ABS3L8H2_9ENTE|nr:sortase [Enterococcus sp. 669A]